MRGFLSPSPLQQSLDQFNSSNKLYFVIFNPRSCTVEVEWSSHSQIAPQSWGKEGSSCDCSLPDVQQEEDV